MGWTHAEDPLNHIPKEALITDFIGSQPGVRPNFKLEDSVQEDAARPLVSHPEADCAK